MAKAGSPRAKAEKCGARRQVPAGCAPADSVVIRSLIEKYAKSVDDADTTLAAQVWWNSPEVSFIHPLGHEHGFEQIKQNVYTRLMGKTFSNPNLLFMKYPSMFTGTPPGPRSFWDSLAH